MRVLWLLIFLFLPGMVNAGTELTPEEFAEQENLSKLQALQMFPALEQDQSEFHVAVAAEMVRLEKDEPKTFKDPKWPLKVARQVAARLGVKGRTFVEILASEGADAAVDWENEPAFSTILIKEARLGREGNFGSVVPLVTARVQGGELSISLTDLAGKAATVDEGAERVAGEKTEDYWSRQRAVLALAEPGCTLKITYEQRGKVNTVTIQAGQRLVVTPDGSAMIEKEADAIPPTTGKPEVKPKRPSFRGAKAKS